MLCPVSAKEGSASAEEMLKNFVATRPRRPKSGRVIAGVAAGIGRRYAIDPVLVRVALVVSAIYGGAGILAYLLGWLFLTAEEDEVSPFEALLGRGHSSTSKGLTIVLCVLLIPASSFAFGGHFSTVAGGILLLGALFLLHRYRGDLGQIDTVPRAPRSSDPTAQGTTTAMTDSMQQQSGPQDAVPPEYRDTPPAWDPLGAAPFAWDLPDPSPVPAPQPPVPARRHRSRVGLATMGIILVTAATLAAIAPHAAWLTVPHIIGILGAIAGIGLIVGAFTHSGRGLIGIAILLSVAGVFLTASGLNGFHGVGNAEYSPTTIGEVQPTYQHSVGKLRLDLAGLTGTGSVKTDVQLGVGDVMVIVPRDATVHATCSTSVGDVHCLSQNDSGSDNPAATANQTGTGPDITLNVHDGIGKVEVVNADQTDETAVPGAPTAPTAPAVPGGGH